MLTSSRFAIKSRPTIRECSDQMGRSAEQKTMNLAAPSDLALSTARPQRSFCVPCTKPERQILQFLLCYPTTVECLKMSLSQSYLLSENLMAFHFKFQQHDEVQPQEDF